MELHWCWWNFYFPFTKRIRRLSNENLEREMGKAKLAKSEKSDTDINFCSPLKSLKWNGNTTILLCIRLGYRCIFWKHIWYHAIQLYCFICCAILFVVLFYFLCCLICCAFVSKWQPLLRQCCPTACWEIAQLIEISISCCVNIMLTVANE